MSLRPRIQRAFFAWLEEARPSLSRAVRVKRRTDETVEFMFDVGAPALQGWLNRHEITVGVFHEEECWDLILDLDAYPERRGDVYVCRQCEREGKHETFASREAVWRDHLFEPFLQWVNETLAPAKVLTLYGSESGGATWARLEQERPTGADLARALCVVPLVPQGDNAAALSP